MYNGKVKNMSGTEITFDAAVILMDDELRESLHREGYDTDQEFFTAYENAHIEKFGEVFELSKEHPIW